MASQAFDLARVPLMRGALLRFEQEQHCLILVLHQLIFDVRSIGIFVQELAALYQAYTTEQASSLSPLPMQYLDFALQQLKPLDQGALTSHLEYWRHLL